MNGAAAATSIPAAGGIDPYAEDDGDQLRNIAKKFEEKYASFIFIWRHFYW